jgi:Gpi18-like mannosyltransferase
MLQVLNVPNGSQHLPSPMTLLLLILGACALKLSLFPLLNADMTFYVLPWLAEIRANGVAVLGHDLTDYSPGYTYFLLLAAMLPEQLPSVMAVKLISVAGDVAMAAAGALLALELTGDRARALLAGAVLFALPTVIANSGAWGQTDAIWTSLSLLAVLSMQRRQAVLAVLCFGLGIAYKPQAVFLGPVLLAFLIRERRWPLLALLPLPYLLIGLPQLLAGRSGEGVFGVYLQQFEQRERLSNAAPSIWAWLPNLPGEMDAMAGLLLAAAVGLWLTLALLREGRLAGPPLLLGAALSCLLLPFLTPKMHDRYFFAGEIMVALAACLRPRLWPVVIATQAAALLAYQPFLLNMSGWRVPVGAVFSLIALVLLLREWRPAPAPIGSVRQGPERRHGQAALGPAPALDGPSLTPQPDTRA